MKMLLKLLLRSQIDPFWCFRTPWPMFNYWNWLVLIAISSVFGLMLVLMALGYR